MDNIELSIIMPVYNSEKYLEKAILSALKNLTIKYELIIINDCSTDNSLKIINKIIKNNKNIILINNEKNIGAGLSRNKGLEIAKGKYIGFIDSDDYVQENYYLNMLESAKKYNSDIVVSDITLVDQNEYYRNIYVDNVYSCKYKPKYLISKELLLGNWACASTCSKIFKQDLIQNYKFSEKNSDDILFTISAIINSKQISYCENNKYYYFQSPNSVTRNLKYKKYKESIECLINAIELLANNNLTYAKIYSANIFFPFICYALNEIAVENIKDFLDIIKNNFKDKNILEVLYQKNPFLSKSVLYTNNYYKKICKYISTQKYDEICKIIYRKENIDNRNLNKIKKKDNFNPLVSIIIPVYNGENYLEEAIKSALAQTYKKVEIIVVNDGSTDNTDIIAKKYKDEIRYFKKENGGVASALNLAIEKMNGEYFSWLSHDDLYFPEKIEYQVAYLSRLKNRNVILFNNYFLINENGRRIGNPVIINHNMIKKKQEYCLLRGCTNGITMLIPKKAFQECGNFDESLRCTQDYDLWWKFLKKFKFVHMKDILTKTRIHSNQDTNSNPLAIVEGEKLWSFMIEDVSDKRKEELEGSIFNYYYKMALHLKNSMYQQTFNKCIKKCKEIDETKYNRKSLDKNVNRTIYQKIIFCINMYGYKETIKLCIKKIFKR